MSREIIRFENVKKEYTVGTLSTQVLNGVDFTVDEGELAVIVGTSGAGKSTILNIIGGMDTPTSGKVVVDGDDISGYKEAQLTEYRAGKIGFVFQFYNLIPNLNVVENVDFGIEVKKDPALRRADRCARLRKQQTGARDNRKPQQRPGHDSRSRNTQRCALPDGRQGDHRS